MPSQSPFMSAQGTSPRVAIVHDWLTTPGGAERVLWRLCSILPNADLFTLIDDDRTLPRALRNRHTVKTSWLQAIPGIAKSYRWLVPLMPAEIERFDFSGYDIVVSSSWAFSHGVKTSSNTQHLAYVHSPMRWAWDMEEEYLEQTTFNTTLKHLARARIAKLRDWDISAAKRPDQLIANSQFIQDRIQRCWSRDSSVIYPPVTIPSELPKASSHGAYVSVSRLVPYKRVDLWVKAFAHLPNQRLIVAGDGPEMAKLKSMATPNITFVGWVSDEKAIELMAGARGFLQASKEDFGISVVEAQGCGTPVLAYRVGGASETVKGLDSSTPTGMLFDDLSPEAMAESIRDFERQAFSAVDCRENALRFSPQAFDQGMQDSIAALLR
jgi:glycosyltransferase involved in cell wall biosynthesis